MTEPSQSRVDLSGIHPLKRVTLIVLRFMFALSLVFAVAGQFVWDKVHLQCPDSLLIVFSQKNGVVLQRWPIPGYGWELTSKHGQSTETHDWPRNAALVDTTASIPGLFVGAFGDLRFITIHHLWLIGTSAALYLFTRWRIRRSARIQNPPS